MLGEFPASAKRKEVLSIDGMELVSAIGHADTAHVLGSEPNRVNVTLTKGDSIIVAQKISSLCKKGVI